MNKVYLFLASIIGSFLLFFNLGKILDVSQKEKKADIIISLGGDDNSRIIKAIELYKNGFSQKKIILITGGTKLTRENMNHDARIKYINNLDENINFIYNPNIKSTIEEITYLKNYMTECNLSKAIIVSDAYHMLRIKMLINLIGFNHKEIILVKSNASWWNSEKYYQNKFALKFALIETIKIPYNLIKYIIS